VRHKEVQRHTTQSLSLDRTVKAITEQAKYFYT